MAKVLAVARPDARKPTNVTLPEGLVSEARSLGVSLSTACEQGLRAAVAAEKSRRFREENAEAIREWNEHVAKHGVMLSRYRKF